MKKIISVFALCLLATAVVIADNPPTTEHKPVGDAVNKPDSPSGLLKTGPKKVVIREVIGQGHNRDEAIKNALYRAVEQVRGVKVDNRSLKFYKADSIKPERILESPQSV